MGLRNLSQLKNALRDFLSFTQKQGIFREVWDKSLLVIKFACAVHVTNTYVCTVVLTYGPSMLPTLSLTGDLLLAEKLSTQFGCVRPGDIVLVRSPVIPRRIVTKRLIGMEGDTITYIVDPGKSDRKETIVVPKGHVWVEGDNIYNSNDSRKFGVVSYGLLHSKVFWRVLASRGILIDLFFAVNCYLGSSGGYVEKSRLKLQWWQILDGSCYRLCKKQLQVLSAAKGSEGQCMDERQWRRLEMATVEVGTRTTFQIDPVFAPICLGVAICASGNHHRHFPSWRNEESHLRDVIHYLSPRVSLE
uniref:MADS11 n=1 Tax=Hippophae rhamnoides TaxID=193516 RepID=A0AAU7LJF4_9ROSA